MYLFELINFVKRAISRENIFVVPCDMLPHSFELPAGFIINTATSTSGTGHWVALWIDEHGVAQFFDSYGFKPRTPEIQRFIRTHSRKCLYNNRHLQQLHSRVCGKYAACFLYYTACGVFTSKFLEQFSLNLKLNDYLIEKMYAKLNM